VYLALPRKTRIICAFLPGTLETYMVTFVTSIEAV